MQIINGACIIWYFIALRPVTEGFGVILISLSISFTSQYVLGIGHLSFPQALSSHKLFGLHFDRRETLVLHLEFTLPKHMTGLCISADLMILSFPQYSINILLVLAGI